MCYSALTDQLKTIGYSLNTIIKVDEGNIQSISAKFEGFLYLANEVNSFLKVTRNIGKEIEGKVSAVHSEIHSPTDSRKGSVVDKMSNKNDAKNYSTFAGDLRRTMRTEFNSSRKASYIKSQTTPQSIRDSPTSNKNSINRSPEIINVDGHESKVTSALAENSHAGIKADQASEFSSAMEIYTSRIAAMNKKIDFEGERVEKLEAQLQLAIHKVKKYESIKDLVAELRRCREELDVAVKE